MKGKRHYLQALAVLAILIAGFGIFRWLESQREEVQPVAFERVLPRVEVQAVARLVVTPKIRARGTVVPRTQTELVAEVAGRVLALAPEFAEGAFFEAGQMLAQIETTDLELALAVAAESVAMAELSVAQEEADASVARREWEQSGSGSVSKLALREPQLKRVRAMLVSAQAARAGAQRDLERATLRAPYAGRVSTTNIDRGSFVSRGTRVASVYSTDVAQVRLPLSDEDLAYIELPLSWQGSEATFRGPEVVLSARFAGRVHSWSGRIVRTQAELDAGTRMLVGVVEIVGPYAPREGVQAPLHAGLFVEAEIEGRAFEAFELPRRALRSAMSEQGLVYVFMPDSTAEQHNSTGAERGQLSLRQVEIARTEGERVFIRQGLEPGELVIVSPLETAVDGMGLALADTPLDAPQ